NRYAYVHGDPLNFGDPRGTDELGEVVVSMSARASFLASLGAAIIPKLPLIIGWLFFGAPDALAYGLYGSFTFGTGTLTGGPVGGIELVFEPREKKMVVFGFGGAEWMGPPGPHAPNTATGWKNIVLHELSQNWHAEIGLFEAWEWAGDDGPVSFFILP